MRLGQLSRKISVRSNEIVTFLAKNGIVVEDSFNARVNDEHVHLVISHFAPQIAQQDATGSETNIGREEAVDISTLQQPIEPMDKVLETEDAQLRDETTDKIQDKLEPPVIEFVGDAQPETGEQESINEVNGVIKPPKVELQGLKVLGKIDLPEPRKKDVETDTQRSQGDESTTSQPPGPADAGRRKPSLQPRRSQNRPRKNPVTLERERRAKEQEEQRMREAENEKQRKTQHYQKRVKPKGPTKAARIHNEETAPVEDFEAPPKSLWGRFIRWLTSY
jgi:hypothetical protein